MYNEVNLIFRIVWYQDWQSQLMAEFAVIEVNIVTNYRFNWKIKRTGKSKWILYAEVENE
jgi:hypothetical protein